jgi:hypothetical protein
MGNSCELRLSTSPERRLGQAPPPMPWKRQDGKAGARPRRPRVAAPYATNTLLTVSESFLEIVDFFEPVCLEARTVLQLQSRVRSVFSLWELNPMLTFRFC